MLPKCRKLPKRLLMHVPILPQCLLGLHLWEDNTGFLQ